MDDCDHLQAPRQLDFRVCFSAAAALHTTSVSEYIIPVYPMSKLSNVLLRSLSQYQFISLLSVGLGLSLFRSKHTVYRSHKVAQWTRGGRSGSLMYMSLHMVKVRCFSDYVLFWPIIKSKGLLSCSCSWSYCEPSTLRFSCISSDHDTMNKLPLESCTYTHEPYALLPVQPHESGRASRWYTNKYT